MPNQPERKPEEPFKGFWGYCPNCDGEISGVVDENNRIRLSGMSPHHKEKECCEKCIIPLDYKPAQCSDGDCPCHQEKELKSRDIAALRMKNAEDSFLAKRESDKLVKEIQEKESWADEFDKKFIPSIIVDGANSRSGLEPLPGITGNIYDIKSFISSTLQAYKDSLKERVEAQKYIFERPKDDYLPEVYRHLKSKNEARDEILAMLDEK